MEKNFTKLLNSFRNEMADIKSDIANETTEWGAKLEEKLTVVNSSLEDMKGTLADNKEELTQLEEKLKRLNSSVEDIKGVTHDNDNEEKLSKLEEELKRLSSSVEDIKGVTHDNEEKLSKLEKKLTVLNSSLEDMKGTLADNKKELTKFNRIQWVVLCAIVIFILCGIIGVGYYCIKRKPRSKRKADTKVACKPEEERVRLGEQLNLLGNDTTAGNENVQQQAGSPQTEWEKTMEEKMNSMNTSLEKTKRWGANMKEEMNSLKSSVEETVLNLENWIIEKNAKIEEKFAMLSSSSDEEETESEVIYPPTEEVVLGVAEAGVRMRRFRRILR